MALTCSFLNGPVLLSRVIVDTDLNMTDWQTSGMYIQTQHKVVVQVVEAPIV